MLCPNCGATVSNNHKCDYCDSLLGRCVDKDIDANIALYGDIVPVKGIDKVCLKVLEIIKGRDAKSFVFCELYTSSVSFAHLLSSRSLPTTLRHSNNGLAIQLTLVDDNYLDKKFRSSELFPLFNEDRECCGCYYIDFGDDYIKAAKVISWIIGQVFQLSTSTKILGCIEMSAYDINIEIDSNGEIITTKTNG